MPWVSFIHVYPEPYFLCLGETQQLQELLKQKEADLEKTESLLCNFQQEVQNLSKERKRLIELQNDLEQELEVSVKAHQQLAEQKSENEKLKEIIDTLKTDLDEALLLSNESELNFVMDRRQSNTSVKVWNRYMSIYFNSTFLLHI